MKLDKNSTIPLHTQIHDYLHKSILSGELQSDSAIPSERELAEELTVSRMTVRQALNTLRKEGLIYQKRGRGTFVSGRKFDVHTRDLGGFSDEMKQRGMSPRSIVLEMGIEKANRETAERLNLNEEADVIKIKRLRLADEIPMAIETTYLPAELFAGLEKFDFEKKSLYRILENNYGVRIYSAAEDLEAAICDDQTAQMLGVKKKSPLLLVYRTVFTEDNLSVEYTKSVYRADRYRASFFLVKK